MSGSGDRRFAGRWNIDARTWMVILFGLYQAAHVVVNGRYMFTDSARAFPAPASGWTDQTVEWARGMAIVDFVNAVASLVFVVAFLRARPWSGAIGLATTSIFTAAAAMFTISVVRIGAFGEQPWFYLFVTITGLPGVWLFVDLLRRTALRNGPA